MSEPRRTDRKRTQTQFTGATEVKGKGGGTKESALSACRAPEAAIASAYEPLVGLKQLGAVEGTALHCTALHCTALHCTALHCTALHCVR
jgi:hypothetical protein